MAEQLIAQIYLVVALFFMNEFLENWWDLQRVLKDKENGPNLSLLAQTV
jgi:hypothetical protein